jgi:hypothetical protein
MIAIAMGATPEPQQMPINSSTREREMISGGGEAITRATYRASP